MRTLRSPQFITFASCVLLVACDDRAVGPPEPQLSLQRAEHVDQSKLLTRFTENVAVALGQDDDLRLRLHDALKSSPFREGKLEFASLLNDGDVGFLPRIADIAGVTPAQMRAASKDLVPLEIYMPVEEHRSTWTGDANLVVASALDEEGILAAFNTAGESVALTEANHKAAPLLVIVPSETDFSRPPQSSPSLSAGVAASSSGSGGVLVMTRLTLTDLHEPYYKGAPEIQVHALDVIAKDYVSCSGDNSSIPTDRQFDQNNSTWVGSVVVTYENALASGAQALQVWEDDDARCTDTKFDPDPDTWTRLAVEQLKMQAVVGLASIAYGSFWEMQALGASVGVIAWLESGAPDPDDFIGVVRKPDDACFAYGIHPAQLYLKDINGQPMPNDYMKVTEQGFERNTCPLETEISGDDYACVMGDPSGNWSALVAGGSGSISYEWYEDGILRGTNSTYSLYNSSEGTRRIEVVVTRDSGVDADLRFIDVIYDPEGEQGCFL